MILIIFMIAKIVMMRATMIIVRIKIMKMIIIMKIISTLITIIDIDKMIMMQY